MAQYADLIESPTRVLDEHNALWLLYKRLAEKMDNGFRRFLLARDWRLLRKYEGEMCDQFTHVLAVSDEDEVALKEIMSRQKKIFVIPIAIDTDKFIPVQRTQASTHILHIGTMFWPPNVDGILWFIKEIYPIIRTSMPDIVFDIVGARPPQEISDAAAANPGINVVGYVDDPLEYYQKAGVLVVPLRAGGGMRVKILNAMAQGIPIVTTALGSEGIKVNHREHLIIADSSKEIANAVIELLNDPELAMRLIQNSISLVKNQYDFRSACKPLGEIYKS
jgi:glycosyltransferase involved in cell wall biosynthesis